MGPELVYEAKREAVGSNDGKIVMRGSKKREKDQQKKQNAKKRSIKKSRAAVPPTLSWRIAQPESRKKKRRGKSIPSIEKDRLANATRAENRYKRRGAILVGWMGKCTISSKVQYAKRYREEQEHQRRLRKYFKRSSRKKRDVPR